MSTTSTDEVLDEAATENEAELEAIADDAVVEAAAEEIEEVAAEQADEQVVEAAAEEIVEEAVLDTIEEVEEIEVEHELEAPAASAEPDLVLDATGNGSAAVEEDVELGGWGHDEDAEEQIVEVESPYDRPGRWYVVHTYSGYENKVRSNMGNVVASRGLEDRVFEVVIPMEDVDEFKGGKKVTVQKKVFPGYLLVRCDLDDDTWGAIRNTPGVTGFVGPGTKPTPLSRREVENILQVKVEGVPGGAQAEPGASSTRSTRRYGSRKAPSPTSRARSPRSTRTSSSSRCWSTSSAGRPWSSSKFSQVAKL